MTRWVYFAGATLRRLAHVPPAMPGRDRAARSVNWRTQAWSCPAPHRHRHRVGDHRSSASSPIIGPRQHLSTLKNDPNQCILPTLGLDDPHHFTGQPPGTATAIELLHRAMLRSPKTLGTPGCSAAEDRQWRSGNAAAPRAGARSVNDRYVSERNRTPCAGAQNIRWWRRHRWR